METRLPKRVKSAIEPSGAQSEQGIETSRSPSHPGAFHARADHCFTGRFSNATANVHALQAEGGITHASRIANEVAHGLLRDTVGPAWGWGNGWQESNGFDEGFNVALL